MWNQTNRSPIKGDKITFKGSDLALDSMEMKLLLKNVRHREKSCASVYWWNLKSDSKEGWNMLLWLYLIQPNHFLKSSQSRSDWDEMVCMSHLMHWDAHNFHTMNAKSQLACGVPFSQAEILRLPRILSRDNRTQRNFKSFHFSIHSTLCLSCNDLPFSSPASSLWHNKTRFWQFSSSICLSAGLAKMYFPVCGADECEASRLPSEEINESFGQNRFLIFITEDVSTRVYSPNQKQTKENDFFAVNTAADWCSAVVLSSKSS